MAVGGVEIRSEFITQIPGSEDAHSNDHSEANTMKGIQSEMKVQHTALMDTLNGALKELTSVLAGVQTSQSVSPGGGHR